MVKENQVSITIGKGNKDLLKSAYKLYGCKSRSDLIKKIIDNWLFTNKPFIVMKDGK